jgi:hypothetical protein
MAGRLARRLAWGAFVLTGLSLVGTLALTALAAKERDNRFCISCHLHEEKFKRFTMPPPTDLAGAHHLKKPEVGCIECHGGADPVMHAKVWFVAGWDTLRFLVGTYEEPTRMRLALRDAECRQCHDPILPRGRAGQPASAGPAPAPAASGAEASYMADPLTERSAPSSYHAIREHDTVNVRCVTCHTSHTTEGTRKDRFISPRTVEPICRECHRQM